MATWGVFFATLAALAAPPSCLAAEERSLLGSQCAVSGTGLQFKSASAYTGLEARLHFSKWGDGVFSSINPLGHGAVELVFAEGARDNVTLNVGFAGDAAIGFKGVRALVQRAAYRASGLAGEAELRVEFDRTRENRCFTSDCDGLEAKGAVLILMMYRATTVNENGSPLGAFLQGVAESDLEKVSKAGFDPGNVFAVTEDQDFAAYFKAGSLAAESGCDGIVHIVKLDPVPSASIPHQFSEWLELSGSELPEPQKIWLSRKQFPGVGPFKRDEIHLRKVQFYTKIVLVSVGLLALFFLLERRKRRLALCCDFQLSKRQTISDDSASVAEGVPELPLLSFAFLPETRPEHEDGISASYNAIRTHEIYVKSAVKGFFRDYSIQDFEEEYSPAVVEYLSLLDAQERCRWVKHQRLPCLLLHFMYVALCLNEPIRDRLSEPGQTVTCYQGIRWERVNWFLLLFVVFKVSELVLLAASNKARGQIHWIMIIIEFFAGLMSFSNSYSDIISIVVARACFQYSWWGGMMVIFIIGVVLFHWTLLVALSLYFDRSNKCLYKILHMSVLAGSVKLHPEDRRAWYLWMVICWSQLIIQDLVMGGLQLYFLVHIENNGSMENALIFSTASFILSFHAAIDPTVTFGREDLHPLRSIAKLQDYMEQDIEDYDKTQMRALLEEASQISLLQESPTLLKAERFKWEQEVQIQEGSLVEAYIPNEFTEKSSRPYPARVERVNHNAFTVQVKLDGACGEEGVSKDSVVVNRRDVVEDRDLTEALIGLGIVKRSDRESWQRAEQLPPWECQVMKTLRGCQRNALKRVRDSAEDLHRRALVKLRERCERLRIIDGLEQIFEWVLWEAPLIIHIDLDTVGRYLMEDSYYRNQFETGTTKGLNILPIREGWEEKLFGECYKDALAFERPKYGVLDIMNDPEGVSSAKEYGRSYAILKQARFRCTLTPRDSGQPSVGSEHVGTLDMCAHVLLEFSDEELGEVYRVATAADPCDRMGDSRHIQGFNYKELQLHGELDLKKHVKRLVVDPQHLVYGFCHDVDDEQKLDQDGIERLCQEHGWELSYIGDPDKARAAGFRESKFKWEKDIRHEQRLKSILSPRSRAHTRSRSDSPTRQSSFQRIRASLREVAFDGLTSQGFLGTSRQSHASSGGELDTESVSSSCSSSA